MDKTLPINILLGNTELCNIVAMQSWINFGLYQSSLHSILEMFLRVACVLPLLAEGYSGWRQA